MVIIHIYFMSPVTRYFISLKGGIYLSKLENNTASLQAVSEKINGVNNEINSQATTIAEIAALLEGKSVPGGGSGGGSGNAVWMNVADLPTTYVVSSGGGDTVYYLSLPNERIRVIFLYCAASTIDSGAVQFDPDRNYSYNRWCISQFSDSATLSSYEDGEDYAIKITIGTYDKRYMYYQFVTI